MKIYLIYNIHFGHQLILHFGIGLIGTSIYNSIQYYFGGQKGFEVIDVPFVWKKEAFTQSFNSIKKAFQLFLSYTSRVTIIWSAGKVGFKATNEEIESEFVLFQEALIHLEKLLHQEAIKNSDFYLFSSAGGLFEGQTNINSSSIPSPMRPYGVLKLKQEEYLMKNTSFHRKIVLRPSSVYSVSNIQSRLGLIPTLVKNGIKNKISYIFGSEDTIRDYILDEEIGDYLVRHISFSTDNEESPHQDFIFLVSCKSSSIYEIKQIIETTLNFKLYIQYSLIKNNSQNMSFAPVLKPKSLKVAMLQINIKKLYLNILNYRYESDLL